MIILVETKAIMAQRSNVEGGATVSQPKKERPSGALRRVLGGCFFPSSRHHAEGEERVEGMQGNGRGNGGKPKGLKGRSSRKHKRQIVEIKRREREEAERDAEAMLKYLGSMKIDSVRWEEKEDAECVDPLKTPPRVLDCTECRGE